MCFKFPFLFYFLEEKMILNGSLFLPSAAKDQQLSFFLFFSLSQNVFSHWYSGTVVSPYSWFCFLWCLLPVVKHCQKTLSENFLNKQSKSNLYVLNYTFVLSSVRKSPMILYQLASFHTGWELMLSPVPPWWIYLPAH